MGEVQTAAGVILAAMVDGSPRYLLMRNARHGTWLPPKGHTDDGESLIQAARREVEEETGITEFGWVDGFEESVEYEVDPGTDNAYRKRSTYFLATVNAPEYVQSDEHDDSGWFTLEEALGRIKFDGMRAILLAAHARLAGTGEDTRAT